MITLKLLNSKAGEYQFDMGYLAKGFSWYAGYTIIVGIDGAHLDLNSWIVIHNNSRMDIKKGHFRIAQQKGDENGQHDSGSHARGSGTPLSLGRC